MSMNLFSDEWALVGTIDPDVNTAGTYLTDAIDMSLYDRVAFVVANGSLIAGGTVAFKVTQATTSGGTYKDVTSAAITGLTGSPDTGSDKQQIVIVDQTALDMDNNYRYVKGSLTIATQSQDGAVLALGRAKYKAASGSDLASVSEIVSV